MICPNCGTQNAEGETVCQGCKEQLPRLDTSLSRKVSEPEPVEKGKPGKTKRAGSGGNRLKNKKLLKVVITATIFLIVVVAGFVTYRYKTKNLNANDPVLRIENVINTFSDDVAEYYKYILPESLASNAQTVSSALSDSKTTPDLLESSGKVLKNAYETWKDTYGDDLAISLDILYKEKLPEETLNEIESFYATIYKEHIYSEEKSFDAMTADIAEKYDISETKAKKVTTALNDAKQYCSNIQVTSGYDIVVRIGFTGRQKTGDIILDVYVVKVDGTWSIDLNTTYKKYMDRPLLEKAFKKGTE